MLIVLKIKWKVVIYIYINIKYAQDLWISFEFYHQSSCFQWSPLLYWTPRWLLFSLLKCEISIICWASAECLTHVGFMVVKVYLSDSHSRTYCMRKLFVLKPGEKSGLRGEVEWREYFRRAGECNKDVWLSSLLFTSPTTKYSLHIFQECLLYAAAAFPIVIEVWVWGESNRAQHQTLVINSSLFLVHIHH